MYYETDPKGISVAKPDVGASFGVGQLRIYKAYSKNRGFPVARSNGPGNYPPVGIALKRPRRKPPARRLPTTAWTKAFINILHIRYATAKPKTVMQPKPRPSIILIRRSAGLEAVRRPYMISASRPFNRQLQATLAPAAQYKIEPSNWNDPKWIEQPMTDYSVEGGSREKILRRVWQAYVYANATLQARSPKRFQFISNGITTWTQQMKYMPPIIPPSPIGDFPVTDQMKHTA